MVYSCHGVVSNQRQRHKCTLDLSNMAEHLSQSVCNTCLECMHWLAVTQQVPFMVEKKGKLLTLLWQRQMLIPPQNWEQTVNYPRKVLNLSKPLSATCTKSQESRATTRFVISSFEQRLVRVMPYHQPLTSSACIFQGLIINQPFGDEHFIPCQQISHLHISMVG